MVRQRPKLTAQAQSSPKFNVVGNPEITMSIFGIIAIRLDRKGWLEAADKRQTLVRLVGTEMISLGGLLANAR